MQDLKLPELKPVIISVGSFVVLFLLKKNSVFDKLDCFCNPGINHLVISYLLYGLLWRNVEFQCDEKYCHVLGFLAILEAILTVFVMVFLLKSSSLIDKLNVFGKRGH